VDLYGEPVFINITTLDLDGPAACNSSEPGSSLRFGSLSIVKVRDEG
jgi:hypothetical protein